MKAIKTIAALCAIGMVVSTMAMPVQAKTTSKTETEVITMDDTPTTTTKTKTTKKSKSSQVSWKNAGKPLKCTVKTEEDFYKAMSNAIRLNAPTLKVTFDKNYKGKELVNTRSNAKTGLIYEYKIKYVLDLSMSYADADGWKVIEHNADYSVATIKLSYSYWGTAFPYAYNTGNTSVVDDKYKTMYKIFSKAADDCTETTDLGKAEYAWNWVIDNMVYDYTAYTTKSYNSLVKIFEKPTADVKYAGVCEDYADAYILLMRMLDIPCWHVSLEGGEGHALACAQINGEYRYFDPTWGSGKPTFNMTAKETEEFYNKYGKVLCVGTYEVDMEAGKQHRKLSYSELEKYFIW